ncbi:MAG: GNAT family N-acetyltransferase [Saprospiraceae bacterium]
MKNNFKTPRLLIDELRESDAEFILELVNTSGWLEFIGDRNINDKDKAIAYIKKIIENPLINYWLVRTIDHKTTLGVITLIKRDYLEYHDIGFAFLPQFSGNGYAYESTQFILNEILSEQVYEKVLATTLQENYRSISLLEKLGMKFQKEIINEDQKLLIFCIEKKLSNFLQ